MPPSDLTATVVECLTAFFQAPIEPDDSRNLIETYRLDSLGVVELISELETRFDCQLDVSGIQQLSTVAAITATVGQALQQTSPS